MQIDIEQGGKVLKSGKVQRERGREREISNSKWNSAAIVDMIDDRCVIRLRENSVKFGNLNVI